MEKLNRMMTSFNCIQLGLLVVGIGCILYSESAAYVICLFAQTIATIIWGVYSSNKITKQAMLDYPYINPMVYGRAYNQAVMKAAKQRGDNLTHALFVKQYTLLLFCAFVDFAMVLCAYIFYGWL